MTVRENHYRRQHKGSVVSGPLICSGEPTVGSSFVDRSQPALLGKFNMLARYMHTRDPPDATSAASKFAAMGSEGIGVRCCQPWAWLGSPRLGARTGLMMVSRMPACGV